jgi:hypothetical protein
MVGVRHEKEQRHEGGQEGKWCQFLLEAKSEQA